VAVQRQGRAVLPQEHAAGGNEGRARALNKAVPEALLGSRQNEHSGFAVCVDAAGTIHFNWSPVISAKRF